jgi:tetratricopeptide (TPR) repeat protein
LWEYAKGHEEQAIAYTEEARAEAAAFGARHLEAMLLSNLAQARTKRGDLAGGQRDADASMAIGKTLNVPESMPDILIGAAYPAIRAGRLAAAQRLIDQADAVRKTARGTVFRARLLYAQGKYEPARALLEKAKAMGDAWFPQYETMLRAFTESARTGRPSTIPFEEPVK